MTTPDDYSTRCGYLGPGLAVTLHLGTACLFLASLSLVEARQILHNLLGNAAKFTSQGRVVLRVEVDKDRRNVLLAVQV